MLKFLINFQVVIKIIIKKKKKNCYNILIIKTKKQNYNKRIKNKNLKNLKNVNKFLVIL